MKKNKFVFAFCIAGIVFTVFILLIALFLSPPKLELVDYSIEYAKIFGSYEIEMVDLFMEEDTVIIYNDVQKTYKELRANVIKAFDEKKYTMSPDSSYGKSSFTKEGVEYKITSFVRIYDEFSVENYIRMIVKDKKISLISSDDIFFGYLFFGEPLEVG